MTPLSNKTFINLIDNEFDESRMNILCCDYLKVYTIKMRMIPDIWSLKGEIILIINKCFSNNFMINILSEMNKRDPTFLLDILTETKEMLPIKTKEYVFNQYRFK